VKHDAVFLGNVFENLREQPSWISQLAGGFHLLELTQRTINGPSTESLRTACPP
jgi:hypothetical protein